MSWPSTSFRSELPPVVRKELDQFAAQIAGVLSPEHQANGKHGAITAPSITVSGKATIGGALAVGGKATIGGALEVGGDATIKGIVTAGGGVRTPALQIGAGAPLLSYTEAAYTPQALGHTGTPFVLGASTLTGWFSQLGTAVTFEVRFVLGAGFVWPAGEVLLFTLPKTRATGLIAGLSTVIQGATGSYAIGGAIMWPSFTNAVMPTLPVVAPAYPGQIALIVEASPFAAVAGNTYGFVGTYRTAGA